MVSIFQKDMITNCEILQEEVRKIQNIYQTAVLHRKAVYRKLKTVLMTDEYQIVLTDYKTAVAKEFSSRELYHVYQKMITVLNARTEYINELLDDEMKDDDDELYEISILSKVCKK